MSLIDRIKSTKLADFAERVASTFLEAGVSGLITFLLTGGQLDKSALIAAFAAGLSAVKVLLQKNDPTAP